MSELTDKWEESRIERLNRNLKRLESWYGDHVDRPTLLLVSAVMLLSDEINNVENVDAN